MILLFHIKRMTKYQKQRVQHIKVQNKIENMMQILQWICRNSARKGNTQNWTGPCALDKGTCMGQANSYEGKKRALLKILNLPPLDTSNHKATQLICSKEEKRNREVISICQTKIITKWLHEMHNWKFATQPIDWWVPLDELLYNPSNH